MSSYFPGVDLSQVLVVSERGFKDRAGNHVGRNIYVNDRFFAISDESKLATVRIHELNRLNGYNGRYQDDYAAITKACGSSDPTK
jgi:hypothetical protein